MLSNLWAAFSMPDDIVKAVGDVGIQASGQVPWFAYPVIIFSSERERKANTCKHPPHSSVWTSTCTDLCAVLKK